MWLREKKFIKSDQTHSLVELIIDKIEKKNILHQ